MASADYHLSAAQRHADVLRMAHDRHQDGGSGQSSDCRDWCGRNLVAFTCIATTF